MADVFDKTKRSDVMRQVRSKDTTPERVVRQALHREGYRFRLHGDDLPGKPDLVLPKYDLVVFIHGCFWHGHGCARGARVPKTNRKYWQAKIARNAARDLRAKRRLHRYGWHVYTIWECNLEQGIRRVLRFLEG